MPHSPPCLDSTLLAIQTALQITSTGPLVPTLNTKVRTEPQFMPINLHITLCVFPIQVGPALLSPAGAGHPPTHPDQRNEELNT